MNLFKKYWCGCRVNERPDSSKTRNVEQKLNHKAGSLTKPTGRDKFENSWNKDWESISCDMPAPLVHEGGSDPKPFSEGEPFIAPEELPACIFEPGLDHGLPHDIDETPSSNVFVGTFHDEDLLWDAYQSNFNTIASSLNWPQSFVNEIESDPQYAQLPEIHEDSAILEPHTLTEIPTGTMDTNIETDSLATFQDHKMPVTSTLDDSFMDRRSSPVARGVDVDRENTRHTRKLPKVQSEEERADLNYLDDSRLLSAIAPIPRKRVHFHASQQSPKSYADYKATRKLIKEQRRLEKRLQKKESPGESSRRKKRSRTKGRTRRRRTSQIKPVPSCKKTAS